MHILEEQISWWRKSWNDNPLKVILWLAIIIRLLAALFSKGYAFHDDHFDVIRVAQDWVDGIPHWVADSIPPNHSMFYPAINALLIYIQEAVGIVDPQIKLIFIRLVHSVYSLLIVILGYKITYRVSNNKSDAIIVGLMLAMLWFMPFLGVKNLVEMVCLPPLMYGFYRVLGENVKFQDWLIAGLFMGLSFTFRLHVIIFAGGLGLVMLFRKQFTEALVFTAGFILMAFLIVGIPDWIIWEYPFQSIVSYFAFNTSNAYNFSTGPFYRFFFTVIGFTVPPISILLLAGYFKGWKISKELWIASLLFFIVHSIFPNKQERFILPFIPFFIIIGVIGWNKFYPKSKFWSGRKRLLKGLWTFFFLANVLTGLALALTYSKKDRIEPLSFLEGKDDVKSVVIASTAHSIRFIPAYYLGKNTSVYQNLFAEYTGKQEILEKGIYREDDYKIIFQKSKYKSLDSLSQEFERVDKKPNYFIFQREENLEERVIQMENKIGGVLIREKVITQSYFDRLLHFFNPRIHKKQTVFIYRLKED